MSNSKIINFASFFLIMLILSSCKLKSINDLDSYRVIKIDSTKNLYIIYFEGKIEGYNTIFRVLSNKNNNSCKNKITSNKKYRLSLDELTSVINYKSSTPRAFIFNETEILLKDSIASSKLYTAKNIDGLCYSP